MRYLILICVPLWLGCGRNPTASRPESYPAAPKSDARSVDAGGDQPGGGETLPVRP